MDNACDCPEGLFIVIDNKVEIRAGGGIRIHDSNRKTRFIALNSTVQLLEGVKRATYNTNHDNFSNGVFCMQVVYFKVTIH